MSQIKALLRAYQPEAGRLIYHGGKASAGFWDEHWSGLVSEAIIKRFNRDVVKWTKRYLPKGSKVLDAGCGTAHTVWSLKRAGFDAWGIDYAAETIRAVNKIAPELQVIRGDVRSLPFEPSTFDGIWSLGVIEHFWEGFDAIAQETARTLKRGGHAFVTVPTMSPIRNLKARFGFYPQLTQEPESFYQFALPRRVVIEGFEKHGFVLLASKPRGGFKGLKDEIDLPWLQRFYDSKVTGFRIIRGILDRLLAPLTCHSRLYIFVKS